MPVRRFALLVALALLPGCGGAEKPPPDPEVAAVRTALAELRKATEAKDYKTLCTKSLAPELVGQVTGIGLPCEVALQEGLGDVEEPKLTVGRVRVTGTKASAEVTTGAKGQKDAEDIVELAKIDGRWRVTSLAGSSPPTPPGTTTEP